MLRKRLWPTLSDEFTKCARAFYLDLMSSIFLFVCASFMAGRVWRFPFDDEADALFKIECCHSPIELLTFYLKGGDIHPPVSQLLFYELQHLGMSEAAMRLCSIAMTALALAFFHLIALALVARRSGEVVSLTSRLIAVLLFGLSPLAIGQGDAIRWYPLFAMLVSLFVTLYLFSRNETARLWSSIPLGLAASTNFLAIIVFAPFALYRYGLQRQFRASFDFTFWLVVLLFAGCGIISAYSIFGPRFNVVMQSQLDSSVVQAVMSDVLGFFGGYALGISQAWIIVPAVVFCAVAAFSEIDRTQPANPVHLFLLMLVAAAMMVLPGFSKPRSFLYLAPVVAVLLTLFLDRQVRRGQTGRVVLLSALILAPSFGVIANIKFGAHPFKRDLVIPYQSIVDFIQINERGSVLVISTDPVIPWELRQQHDSTDDRCATYFLSEGPFTVGAVARCLGSGRRYDSIFVITGHSDKSADAAFMQMFHSAVETLIAGRQKMATMHAGVDEDADMKSFLTGVPLDKYILTVDFYK
jgi:hypothetical protein